MRVVTLEAGHAVVVRRIVTAAEMPAAQREARAILRQALPPAVVADAPGLTVWRRVGDRFDYAPGLLVKIGFALPPAVTAMMLPAARAALLTLSGGFERLPEAWAELFAACRAQGLDPSGLCWEVYGREEDPTALLHAALNP